MIQTSKENSLNINNFYTTIENMMVNLYSRWQDEKEYEDINDYKNVIAKEAEKFNIKVCKMNKKPFGFNFTIDTDAVYTIKINSTQYSWARIQ